MLIRASQRSTRATRSAQFSSVNALLSLSRRSALTVLRPSTRFQSTVPSSFRPGGPDPPSLYPTPPPSDATRRSATSEFYRALVPAMLHCLALGSIVYYALELGWMWLKREKEGGELRDEVERLERELERVRRTGAGVEKGEEGEKEERSWWKLW
ncbi:hypothetical protein JCM11251_007521 [Rhodosporidiobolus azoricus]